MTTKQFHCVKSTIISLCLLPMMVFAKTIYVDGSLPKVCMSGTYSANSRSCSGSDGDAYRTVQSGFNAMSKGDTLLVRDGTYHEQVHVNKSGQPGAWLTIKGYGHEIPHMDGNHSMNAGFSWGNAHHIRIEKFYFTGYKYKGIDFG